LDADGLETRRKEEEIREKFPAGSECLKILNDGSKHSDNFNGFSTGGLDLSPCNFNLCSIVFPH